MIYYFSSLILSCLSLFKAIAYLGLPLIVIAPVVASPKLSVSSACPKDLNQLTSLLIKDLPDYSNRVIQRTQEQHQNAAIDTYIIAAGKAENEPLNLPQINYDPAQINTSEQIFFTVLERQYNNLQKIERETYHWLFVTPSEDGWYLVTMFSRFGTSNQDHPPTPPQESSKGIIGQAVNLWLRDCRANLVRESP